MNRLELISRLQAQIDDFSAGSELANSDPALKTTNSKKRQVQSSHSAPDANGGNAAFRKVVSLVNASDKSEKAIRERLSSSGFDESEIDEAVQKAKEYGFINDVRFADVLIRSRISQGKGIAGIERELRSHDIEPSTMDGWPESYDFDSRSEEQRALDLLSRKPPRSKNIREGAYRKLIQHGYSSSTASSVARIWHESHFVN